MPAGEDVMEHGFTSGPGDVRIYYEFSGRGPVILASHGYTSSSHVWREVGEALSASHRVVAWDMRGHGKSDYPELDESYTVEASVADMAAVLDAVGADTAILMGHSLGGFLSLDFARTHPDRVTGLVLVGTGPGYRKDDARARWNQFAEKQAAAFERDGLAALGSGGEVRTEAHRDANGLARAARGILAQRDSRVLDHLPAIAVPTLVVVGEADAPFLDGSRYMAA